MIFNKKQLKIFKGVRERTWYQQDRLDDHLKDNGLIL